MQDWKLTFNEIINGKLIESYTFVKGRTVTDALDDWFSSVRRYGLESVYQNTVIVDIKLV